jgi:hypothetical protein
MEGKDTKTQQYTFRIPTDLKNELERVAAAEDRSLSKQIIYCLRNFLRERTTKD